MTTMHYEVTATFADDHTANRWLAWLRDGHIAEVIRGGAARARIVRLDEPPRTYVVLYEFASREIFDAYLRDHAPRLREEGLRLFPPPGVTYARRSGEVLWACEP